MGYFVCYGAWAINLTDISQRFVLHFSVLDTVTKKNQYSERHNNV